ncbi:MAG: NAD(P)/FAD-dependent oxidoreductase [Paracoccaceae bacterium]
MEHRVDTLILGAGAAGMMCAAHAGVRGGRVLVVDHARAPGEKIRISGGGRCNFTNLHAGPGNFLSGNPHFAKSALARYTQWDFLDLVARHRIAWHEKTLGQLFCDDSARQIVTMLLDEMRAVGAELRLQVSATAIEKTPEGFRVALSDGSTVATRALVLATGGKSIPKMGATGFAYDVARQFGLRVTETRPALVPLTFGAPWKARMAALAGVALPVRAACAEAAFDEAMLFTHRGLSGPAILQASSYWREGAGLTLTLLPDGGLAHLKAARARHGRRALATVLAEILPQRLATAWADWHGLGGNVADCSDARLAGIAGALARWEVLPAGSEGYRTAEVTLGGVATEGLDARTMEAKAVPGLYVIGEAVDVTGWLGGYNFQWAWSSGWAAGTAIAGAG